MSFGPFFRLAFRWANGCGRTLPCCTRVTFMAASVDAEMRARHRVYP
jgi:hypothetical protein